MDKPVYIMALEHDVDRARAEIADFAARLTKNAANAFDWSREAFAAAATLEIVAPMIKNLTTGKVTLVAAEQLARGRALFGARDTSSSTSAPANVMDRDRVRAWAKLAESLAAALEASK